MLKPKFDFDASLDRALQLVMDRTDHRTEEAAMDLAIVITRRDANVVRMANVPFWSPEWHLASERIAKCDEQLAAAGLV